MARHPNRAGVVVQRPRDALPHPPRRVGTAIVGLGGAAAYGGGGEGEGRGGDGGGASQGQCPCSCMYFSHGQQLLLPLLRFRFHTRQPGQRIWPRERT